MKKILMAVFAVLMLAAWVAPAMADTTFYGTYRVRLFTTNNANDYSNDTPRKTYTGTSANTQDAASTTDSNSWIDQRFRLGVESKASDNLRGFMQLQIGDSAALNGSHVWGTTATTVTYRQAYLSFNAGPVRIKAGRQVFGDAPDGGQSFRVSDDGGYYGLWDGGLVLVSVIDAFVLTTKAVDPLTINFAYAKLTESSSSAAPDQDTSKSDFDSDVYILQASITPSDAIKGGAYLLYNRDKTTVTTTTGAAIGTRTPWWVGAGLDAKLDQINLKAHAAYKGGSWENGCQSSGTGEGTCGLTAGRADLDYSAYAIDADASINLGQATVGVVVGLGSGDDSSQDTERNDFTAVAGAYGVQLGQRPAIFFDSGEVSNGGATLDETYADGTKNTIDRSTLGNIRFAQIYGSFKASDELTVSGLAAMFWRSEDGEKTGATTSTSWDSELGTEVDLTAVYKLYKELALVAQAAWFLPGEGILTNKSEAGNHELYSFATDDAVSEYFAKIQYDF